MQLVGRVSPLSTELEGGTQPRANAFIAKLNKVSLPNISRILRLANTTSEGY